MRYSVSLTCRSQEEAHIRALLVQSFAGTTLALRRLDSNDLDGGARVVVTALFIAPQKIDTDVQKIVGRICVEPVVSAVRWQADPVEDQHLIDSSVAGLR